MSTVVVRPFLLESVGSGALGDWRLGARLGVRDGVAVYEAAPPGVRGATVKYVAKCLTAPRPDPASVAAFQREAAALAAVRDPHVVASLAARVDAPPYYFVMPRLLGQTLDRKLQAAGKLSVAETLWIGRQAAAGLAALHAAGWLHGDVKPANLFVSPAGHVTLIDLGHARNLETPHEIPADGLTGAPEYIPPEAACSRLVADARSDLYSLGVVMYELLAGRMPFAGTTPDELVAAHLSAEPPPLREQVAAIPNDVAALVHQLLHKQPLRRPQSASELRDRLAQLEIVHLDER